MSDALHEVAALVLRESGVVIRASQMPALAAAIRRVGAGLTAEALLADAGRPEARQEIVERLIDEVTVKETFFLRHREELDAIDWPGLAARAMTAGRTSVRVWSAACSSGEEAYTLAILALKAFAPEQPPVDILATDIAHSALARAAAGRYGLRSLRHVDETMRSRWFVPSGKALEVGDAARRLVRFGRHNLLNDPFPPAGERSFDLVVCRNVLIYFEPEAVKETIRRLQTAVVPGGKLILGAADRLTGGPAADTGRPEREPPRRRAAERRPRSRVSTRERHTPVVAASTPPLDADTEFELGLTALAGGDAGSAIEHLRRALYLAPAHAAAAFQLARAHEAGNDPAAARRAYWQALALLDDAGEEVGGVARRDLETAARARLDALSGE